MHCLNALQFLLRVCLVRKWMESKQMRKDFRFNAWHNASFLIRLCTLLHDITSVDLKMERMGVIFNNCNAFKFLELHCIELWWIRVDSGVFGSHLPITWHESTWVNPVFFQHKFINIYLDNLLTENENVQTTHWHAIHVFLSCKKFNWPLLSSISQSGVH